MKNKCLRCSSPAIDGKYCKKHQFTKELKPKDKRRNRKWGRRRTKLHWTHASVKWHKFARAYLDENLHCVGCGAPAEHADHILPARHFEDLIFEESNLQALCRSCHSRKTNVEKTGIAIDYKKKIKIRFGKH